MTGLGFRCCECTAEGDVGGRDDGGSRVLWRCGGCGLSVACKLEL